VCNILKCASLPNQLLYLMFAARPTLIAFIILCISTQAVLSQDSVQTKPVVISSKIIGKVNSDVERYNNKIDRQTEKYLRKLEQQEGKLQRKLAKIDSSKAAQLFAGTKEKYETLLGKLHQKTPGAIKGAYMPNLDSLGISLNFLKENNEYLAKLKQGNTEITKVSEQFKQMQGKLSNADEIRQYIKDRKQLLKQVLDEYGLGKYLKKFSKQGYYYSRQIQEYKEAWKDPQKMERKMLELLNAIPIFKKFAEQNSQLAGLFNLPANYGSVQSIAGLQTRASVSALIQTQVAVGGPNAMQTVQQNIQQAQSQLSKLKDKVSKFGGGSSDVEIPDFVPNSNKTKTFWQRIQFSTDLQTNRGSRFLPNIADLAFGISYKLNDKKQIGSQMVYKAGLGNGLNNIKLTHQGIGYRFFTDIKLKKSFWISAGYENNYMSTFKSISELKQGSYWQESALAGISKKYKLKKKGGEMKLLYNFLWNKQVGGQRIVWRTGFSF
jgi:hypothetical protein